MHRIIKSLGLLVGAAAVIGAGVTGAFFSDTETSVANSFTAGAVDLLVDNTSYYNGVFNQATSWELTNLLDHKFFNFLDLKPGDWGEDTISLHINTNDSYLCAEVTLTSNDDNEPTEPEALVDNDTGPGLGELAGLVNFIWWADDGDNVLEDDETPINGPAPIGALTLNQPFSLALADSDENIWGGVGPVDGDTTHYIGKAWCFGTMTLAPVPAGQGVDPTVDGGFDCDGSLLGDESQTDTLTADITFTAVQSRNNPNYQCDESFCEFSENTPGPNLVTNGGFEAPEVATAQNWNIFDSVAGGWTIEWRGDIPPTFGPQNRPDPAHIELHEGVLGAASEGDQYAELDSDWGGPTDGGNGEPASTEIYQSITTVPGATYKLTYAFAPRPNTVAAENDLEVQVEGNIVDSTGTTVGGGGPIAWTQRSVNFVATDASTEIRFVDRGTANSLGTFLDDVSVEQISCAL